MPFQTNNFIIHHDTTTDFLAAITAATDAVRVAHPTLTEGQVHRALDSYRVYFRQLPQDPDLPPPDTLDPVLDAVLLAIWDTIVEREARELDGPADTLDAFYAQAFAFALKEETVAEEVVEEEAVVEEEVAPGDGAQVQSESPEAEVAEPAARPAVLQLKITILGSRPPIWRRILVPAGFDLEQLHHAIQATVGWRDAQLHEFHATVGGSLSSARDLAQVFGEEGTQLLYEYGDGQNNWVHTIVLERFREREPGQVYPTCTGGERACPPEDRCDGIAAYDNMLAALADPSHPDHGEFAGYITEDFNPSAFNITQAEVNLSRYQSR